MYTKHTTVINAMKCSHQEPGIQLLIKRACYQNNPVGVLNLFRLMSFLIVPAGGVGGRRSYKVYLDSCCIPLWNLLFPIKRIRWIQESGRCFATLPESLVVSQKAGACATGARLHHMARAPPGNDAVVKRCPQSLQSRIRASMHLSLSSGGSYSGSF